MLKQMLWHPLEYGLFRMVVGLAGICPQKLAGRSGRVLGALAWSLPGIRRKEVLESLSMAFPEKSRADLKKIGSSCYRNLGEYFVEMFRIPRLSTTWMERHIRFEAREILDSALGEGRGVVNVTFHYGNWELMGAFAARLGYPLDVIARGQKNRFSQRYITAVRQANGMRLIPVEGSPGLVVQALRQGRIVSFLADQDSHEQGVFVDFLGRPASTPRGPALFAHKTGAPVVISMMLPEEQGRWKLVFERVPRPDVEDREEFVYRMTKYFTDRLAERVREHPEHWFWPHRRWKTKRMFREPSG